MTVAFLGNSAWSVPSLRALAEAPDVSVVGVFTRPPVPVGRGSRLTPTPVAEAATRLSLPLFEVDSARSGSGFDRLRGLRPGLIVVVAYGEILPAEVLAIPGLAALNLHFSLLPSYRGSAPVQRALLDGLTETGVSVMLMDEGTDTGPVLARRPVPIEEGDDSGTLGARLAEVGAEVLTAVVSATIGTGGLPPAEPQDEAAASMAPRITVRTIDWSRPADEIVNLVRALAPTPGAVTSFRGARLKVLRAQTSEGSGEPGRLLRADPAGPVFAAGGGAVRLLEVAPAGRKHMRGSDFARGARLDPGDRLGDSA